MGKRNFLFRKIETDPHSQFFLKMSTNLTIENYSDKSFVVRGETKPHKDKLKELQGKWNGNLTGGGGWIFSNKHREAVEQFVQGAEKSQPEAKEEKKEAVKVSQSVSVLPTVITLRETIEKTERAILSHGLFAFIPVFEEEDGIELPVAQGKFQNIGLEYWVGKRIDFTKTKAKTRLTLILSFYNSSSPIRCPGWGVVVNGEVIAFILDEIPGPESEESEQDDE